VRRIYTAVQMKRDGKSMYRNHCYGVGKKFSRDPMFACKITMTGV